MEGNKCYVRSRSKCMLWLLLLMCGDIETCPGTASNKCHSCQKTIRINQAFGLCAVCTGKYHLKCLTDQLDRNVEKFFCSTCLPHARSCEEATFADKQLKAFSHKRGYKICHQNINGILRRIDHIRLLLQDKSLHLLGISETHINNSVNSSELFVDGYQVERNDRSKGHYGEVICFIREDIRYLRRFDLDSQLQESIWLQILVPKSKSFLLCIIYRPPSGSLYVDNNFSAKFKDVISLATSENKKTIVSGDLNCDFLKKSDCDNIKETLRINGFKQVINEPTRVTRASRTLIDIIATNAPHNIAAVASHNNSFSDHNLVGICRKANTKRFQSKTITVREYKNYHIEALKQDLRNIPWEICFKERSFNRAYESFKSLLISIINQHCPLKQLKIRGKDNLWFTKEIKQKMLTRDFHLKRAKHTQCEQEWSRYKSLKNQVNNMIKHAKANYCRSLFKENMTNPKCFWKQIKKCYPSKSDSSISKVFKENGKLLTDKKEIAERFCSYFCGIGSEIQRKIPFFTSWSYLDLKYPQKLAPLISPFRFQTVCKDDVLKALKQLKSSKFSGTDNLPANILKDIAEQLSGPLSLLTNLSFQSGQFPTAEKTAIVTPIYKSGDKGNMENYRPISVLNNISKVIERLAYNQI